MMEVLGEVQGNTVSALCQETDRLIGGMPGVFRGEYGQAFPVVTV